MADVTGTIKAIVGQAFAISPDGSRRLLVEGDKILTGEQIDTGTAGAVTVSLVDGETLDLGQGTLWDSHSHDLSNTSAAGQADVTSMQQAIAEGLDPTQTLEATAAGTQAGIDAPGAPGEGGAHSHVILDLTGEVVDPTAGYATEGLDFPDADINEEITILDADTVAGNPLTGLDDGDSVDDGDGGDQDDDGDNSLQLTVSVHSESETVKTSEVIHVNGGSDAADGLGFDVINGVIVAIGDNVRIWLTSDGKGGTIETPPTCKDPASQIQVYDCGNSPQTVPEGNYSDIFVVGDYSGSYKNGSFVSLTKIHGDNTKGTYKDYLFVAGNSSNYNASGSENSGQHENKYNAVDISVKGGAQLVSANHISGVMFGDGNANMFDGTTNIDTAILVTLDISIALNGDGEYLSKVTLTGIPEGAEFSMDGLRDVIYDGSSYTLIFNGEQTRYDGKMTIILPEDETGALDNIDMAVETDNNLFDMNFDGNTGIEYDSNNISDQMTALTENLAEENLTVSAMATEHLGEDIADDLQTDDNALLTADNTDFTDDNPHVEETLTAESDTISVDSTDHDSGPFESETDTHSGAEDNPLVDFDDVDDNHVNHIDSDISETDTHGETPESTLETLMGGSEDSPLHAMGTSGEESHPDSETHSTSLLSSDEPIHLDDVIAEDEVKDISEFIQVPEDAEMAEPPISPEHVPAEGGDVDNSDSWAGHEANQVEDLIAKPEVDA